MLELRVKDLAAKTPPGSVEERKALLRRCLGLDPLPPKTEMNVQTTGTIQRQGYRIEKLRYESCPGEIVTAHLYLPEGGGKWPVVLRPHGHWEHKKASPIVQAGAISLVLAGYACLVVDSPGLSWDDNAQNERRGMGKHEDWFLSMGMPIQGVYAWDLVRGLDYLATRSDIDMERVGITGASGGGQASLYTFAIDDRIKVAIPVVSMASLEVNVHLGCLCNHVPGVMMVGDRSDILALRADNGAVMVLAADVDPEFPLEGHRRTEEKLKKIFRAQRRENAFRFEHFYGEHDYNRRMREAALAFFNEHLKGAPSAPYATEARPITDGHLNPYPAETVDPLDPELMVGAPGENRVTLTFRDLLSQGLDEPYPDAYVPEQRIAPWKRYGGPEPVRPGAILAIHDETVLSPKEPSSIGLPASQIDQKLCILLGLGVAETLAQMLHYALPGGPEGWEVAGAGLAGDAITTMIASVRTLVSTPEAPPKLLIAEGPTASLVARFLARYRPDLEVQTSHLWTSWREAFDLGIRENAQPSARYLEWI